MNVPVPRGRLVALLVAMAVAFAGLVWRLADVQGVSAERYAVFGESQRLESRVLPADRGSILDRNGAELAISLRRQTVWADPVPRDATRPAAARALAPVLGLDEDELRDQLSADTEFVYLARKVEDDVAAAVEALDLAGRVPHGGAQALPAVGHPGRARPGRGRRRRRWACPASSCSTTTQLTGQPGRAAGGEGHRRATTSPPASASSSRPQRGDNLVLTIDQAMQYETERVLAEQIVASKAKGGIAIVMDPRTGEILALANLDAGQGRAPRPRPASTTWPSPGSTSRAR